MAITYTNLIARNVRSARAAADLSQADVAERMRGLGFTEWRRQTVGNTERGKRRLTCEEAVGLMVSMETTFEAILLPPKDLQWQDILLPAGQGTLLPVAELREHRPSGVWDGNIPRLTPYAHGEPQDA